MKLTIKIIFLYLENKIIMQEIQSTSYHIYFKEKGYFHLSKLISENNYSSIFILVDSNTLEHCYPKFAQNFATEKHIEVIQIEAGEINKNIETCVGVWQAMTELNADRKSLLINLGGGVVTDLGGFVASTFKRGIDFVNIPTSLLAMVDASVGGKTGIDLENLKNQIGLFANPKMVLVDSDFLYTLDPREIRSGTAEIIKYGLTFDQHLYNEIRTNNNLNIIDLIHRSIEIKNNVVLQDPKEKNLRKVLNFGHTIGHAIESYFLSSEDKENLTHGEAIAFGMICETYISSKLFDLSTEKVDEIKTTITNIYGKLNLTENDFDTIIELLKHDKKNTNGLINFVLLNQIENFKIDCKVDNALILESFYFLKN